QTMQTWSKDRLLSPYRVLDLSDEKGTICGYILAQLGAEVIKVESPRGGDERRRGPFSEGVESAEKSLFWTAFNSGKKGVTLDLESSDGREIFKKLVRKTDIVLESFRPGYLKNLGLDYSALNALNQGVVMVSITPFGQTGPFSTYEGPDLVVTALSGYLYLCGDTDRAPVRVTYPLSYGYAATNAAAAALVALYERETSGVGQHVDVSAQESMTEFTLMAPTFWDAMRKIPRRAGQSRGGGSVSIRDTWECKDGWVAFSIYGGEFGGRMNKMLIDWINSEGLAPEQMRNLDWYNLDMAKVSDDVVVQIEKCIGNFFERHTRTELFEGCMERGINLCPVWTAPDLLDFVQLNERNYWVDADHPELGKTLKHTGPFFSSTEVDGFMMHPAPQIGQHNNEVYSELLNYSETEIHALKKEGVI
ncbi:MAG TPA: CoA transferase, partial [Syntrophorhabdaceae bacterium]|nr:CoA transferase [Syntrophorhabdaceae bacterium]